MTKQRIITACGGWIVAAGLLAGAACAPGEQPDQQPTASPAATPPTTPESPTDSTPTGSTPTEEADDVRTIRVAVTDGEVSPPPDRISVDQGERVRIVVSSGRSDEIHVHGYDVTADVEPDDPATVEFVADRPGLFEVETHDTGTLLFQLAVQG